MNLEKRAEHKKMGMIVKIKERSRTSSGIHVGVRLLTDIDNNGIGGEIAKSCMARTRRIVEDKCFI